jgi:hypothetical protein
LSSNDANPDGSWIDEPDSLHTIPHFKARFPSIFPMNIGARRIPHMATHTIAHYDHPAQFEPLIPSEALSRPLYEKASDLMLAGKSLAGLAMAHPRSEIRSLLRSMNSYYTNLMEGEHTRPSEI